ncbi:Serine/threonine-protein phosphatase 7 long form homolog [Linum perenne]
MTLDPELITALVEKCRPKTNTFHLYHGEETITLEDVQFLIGLIVDGRVMSWRSKLADHYLFCKYGRGSTFPLLLVHHQTQFRGTLRNSYTCRTGFGEYFFSSIQYLYSYTYIFCLTNKYFLKQCRCIERGNEGEQAEHNVEVYRYQFDRLAPNEVTDIQLFYHVISFSN